MQATKKHLGNTFRKITKISKKLLGHLAKQFDTTVQCERGHANGPEADVLTSVVCKNEHGAKARTPLCEKSVFEQSGFA